MVYLDNAATTLKKPFAVYQAVLDAMINYGANPGRSAHRLSMKLSEKIYEAREELSALFNAGSPERIIFTNNATEALNIAIQGSVKPGDHILVSSMEHNSVLRPVKHLEDKGVEMDVCYGDVYGRVRAEDIVPKIKENTSLCVLIHASNVCGTINDITDIGRILKEKNILFLVDASQTAGIVDIDVKRDNIDMLAFAGHKALMGPQGTGGLYVREGIELCPLKYGGTGSESHSLYQPVQLPDRLESGTLNGCGISGLCEGVKFIRKNGVKNLFEYEKSLVSSALSDISVIKGVNVNGYVSLVSRCSVISVTSEIMSPEKMAYIMDKEYNIALRAGYHCAPLAHKTLGTYNTGSLRMSVGVFNTQSEIKYFCQSLDKMLRTPY